MSSCCQNERLFLIRNTKSGLVLDATQDHVLLQESKELPAQLWTLHGVQHGRFVIINKGNGKVLDIEGGAKKGASLITCNRHGGVNQQWHIDSDGTITCPIDNLVVDIFQNKLVAGNKIIAHPKHNGANQLFQIEHK